MGDFASRVRNGLLAFSLVAVMHVGAAAASQAPAAARGPAEASSHCGVTFRVAEVHTRVSGAGTVDPASACVSARFFPATLEFRGNPAEGWEREGWEGCSGEDNGACYLLVDEAREYVVSASFRDVSPPTRPNIDPGRVTESEIDVVWAPSTDNAGVTAYELFLDGRLVATVDGRSYTFKDLECATPYTVAVRGRDAAGNVSEPSSAARTTKACTADTAPPSSPTGLAVGATTGTSIALAWNPASDNVGVTGYDVYRDGIAVGTVSGTSHTFAGLACGTTYTLGVDANDAAGNSSETATLRASTAACAPGSDTTPPAVPGGLTVTSVTQTSVGLTWSAATDNVAVTDYDVLVNGALSATTAATSHVVGGLACGASVAIAVRARDAAGNVSQPASQNAATAPCDGDPPSPDPPPPPPPGEPTIGDAATPPGPDELPPPTSDLLASVGGTGSGRIVVRASGRALFATAAAPIACGGGSFRCAARLPSGTSVTLVAKAAPGSRFVRWNGACSGSAPACRVELSATKAVQAVFGPRNARSLVAVSLTRPRVSVRWSRSVGRAAIVVRGRVARASLLRVQIRRPGGGPLVTQVTPVLAGRFRLLPRLAPGLLPRGASVFPGGFVVTVRGRSGQLRVPLQIQTVVLPAPPEGVVRRVFASGTEDGPAALRLPAAATEAWAHFRFEAQPRAGRKLTVAWYRPNGTLIGVVDKANQPEVTSYLRSDTGIASGAYRAELRAGGRVVKVLSVRIG